MNETAFLQRLGTFLASLGCLFSLLIWIIIPLTVLTWVLLGTFDTLIVFGVVALVVVLAGIVVKKDEPGT